MGTDFADVLKKPIDVMRSKKTGAQRVAVAAGIAAGVYKNYEDAADKTVSIAKRFSHMWDTPVFVKRNTRHIVQWLIHWEKGRYGAVLGISLREKQRFFNSFFDIAAYKCCGLITGCD